MKNIEMKTYKSKIDVWFVVLFFMMMLLPTIFTLIDMFSWTMVVLEGLLLLLVSILLFNTKYIIEGEYLYVKCGFLPKEKCSISQIVKIKNTRSIISAPAISLDRIEIKLNNRQRLIISPLDKKEFINHLCLINPNIIVE
ncbi:MAG: PH domain-containing protein [Muribaculaceae bacterium]|nr:PH domain-containing protein [Muribaculaceae bacterium]